MKKILSSFLLIFTVLVSYAVPYITVTEECSHLRFSGSTLQDIAVDKSQLKLQQTSTKVSVVFLSGGAQTLSWDSKQARSYGYSLDSLYDFILEKLKIQCDTSGEGISQSTLDDSLAAIRNYIENNTYIQTDSSTITDYVVLASQNAPPGSPTAGDTYLVGNSPSGAWVGHAKDIAEWNGSSWDFTDAAQGNYLYNTANALTYIYRSGNWVQTTGIPALHNGNTISSGLQIGTNNARSLTFETNNVRRGRIDSIGRLHIYNLPASTDTFVAVTNSAGQFGKIGKQAFLSGISGGGGGGDSIAVIRTYAQAKAEYDAKALTAGRQYLMTDFTSIYDQSISDVTKTASGEQLILTATSDSTFSPVVQSIEFPTDIIHYDITVDTTYINAAPAKGKIIYRESADGNKANYDWRKVLMYNPNTMAEALTFDLTQGVYSTEVTTPTGQNIAWTGFEFPASYITGATYHNPDNLMINTYVIGDFSHNSGNLFFSCNLAYVNQVASSSLNTVEIGGEFSQCTAMSLDNVTITGNLTSSVTGTWANSTFGENVNKCIEVNFNNTTVTGRIDRLINSVFLTDTLGARLYWCENVFMEDCNVTGDFIGVNSTAWVNTTSNCVVAQIKGITHNSEKIGFKDCTITGTTANSVFGNLIVECLVDTKTITQALYPELFSEVYSKTIYKTPDGDIFYRYLDNTNTWVYTQIP